jgi:hypothetical protein
MTRPILALAVLVPLAACTGGAQQSGIDLAQNAGAGVVRNLSAADLARLKDACTAAAPALITATGSTAPQTVKDVAVYPFSFCQQLLTGATGNVDQSSLDWFPQVMGYVKATAQVAQFVLPLILPFL